MSAGLQAIMSNCLLSCVNELVNEFSSKHMSMSLVQLAALWTLSVEEV